MRLQFEGDRTMRTPFFAATAILAFTTLGSSAHAQQAQAPAQAQVKAGEAITKAEATKIKDLVSPGVLWCLQHGMTIKVVDPKPAPPAKDDFRFKELLGPVTSPFDLKGLGGLTFRYRSANRQDETWLYMPTLRRVRRMSTAQRSDALFGQDTDPDSYWGYNGHIAWMDWKLLGVKKMLTV